MFRKLAILALSAMPLAHAYPPPSRKPTTSEKHYGIPINTQPVAGINDTNATLSNGGVVQGGEPKWELTWLEDWSQGYQKCWNAQLGHGYPGGPYNWGTQEIEEMTADPSNVFIKDGVLNIIPRNNSGAWTSARIETNNQRFFMAEDKGRMKIEAKIKLPDVPVDQALGLWPAFWTMGRKFRDEGPNAWPSCGEVDILENVNGESAGHFTVHCGVAPGGPCDEFTGKSGKGNLKRGVFHTFSMVVDRTASTWQEENLTWYIDDVQQKLLKGSEINDEAAWNAVAHQGLFIILNVAIGGAFPNAVNPKGANQPTPTFETVGDRGMEVAFVKVWNSKPYTQ